MNKTAIKNFSTWARRKLISEITYKARLLGITDQEIAKAENPADGIQIITLGKAGQTEITGSDITSRDMLIAKINEKAKDLSFKNAFENVIEEVAYTWFNRLIAIRFMEANDYLPSGIRVLSSESAGKAEPDMVTTPFETDMDFSDDDIEKIRTLKDENKLDELFRFLFIKQCKKLHEVLPNLFEETDDYTELLLTISFTDSDGIVAHLINDIPEDDFNVEKEGQIEIIGWLYQYYNSEKKDEVFAALKKNVKITKENIPAATQLFTPDWIVRYMVENSLGRLWYEGHKDDNIKTNWKYYLDEAEQEPEVEAQLAEIRKEYAKLKPEDIKCIDPCMGSGHILVYMFDVLMQIYLSYGYTQRDAARSIIENNLYGIDIDDRAAQLAYFAVMMKGREYDRRFLTRGARPNVISIQESNNISLLPKNIATSDSDMASVDDINYVLNSFEDAKEYGSILKIEARDYDKALDFMARMCEQIAADLTLQGHITDMENPLPVLVQQAKVLSQKYDVVVTNPPYMGSSGMSGKLSKFVKKNYKDSKSDLFAVFIEKCGEMLKADALMSMITQHAWMFLSSHEKLREKLQSKDYVNMAHLGARAFEEIGGEVVQTTSFVMRACRKHGYKGTYCRLIDPTSEQGKADLFLSGECRFSADQDNFSKIPGSPVAYWVSERVLRMFEGHKMSDYSKAKCGLGTSNNEVFIRFWHEVALKDIGFKYSSINETKDCKYRWMPHDKGGGYRKWYGNQNYIVNFFDNGKDIRYVTRNATGGRVVGTEFYFKEHFSWGSVTTIAPSFRYFSSGFIFDAASNAVFPINDMNLYSILGFSNTKILEHCSKIMNPTVNFGVSDFLDIPFENIPRDDVLYLVKKNIFMSSADWDSFETSWDFSTHPFVRLAKTIGDEKAGFLAIEKDWREMARGEGQVELCYLLWKAECAERFSRLKENEEELNRIFIEIYGLEDELAPEVEDKDITVNKVFDCKDDIPESMGSSKYARTKKDDVVSFISYAVGCMFGRYSLDAEGLAFAGGEWDDDKYRSFIPDDDNCIPITDEEYFEDDIVGRFIEFLKAVYGEESLEANLDFIADALEGRGNTSREVIRNYFLKDFFKNHCKTYQKRPIYWMFDSGRQNGFKALVYMHRWNADTVGNVRIEYLHKMQSKLESEITRMQEVADSNANNREKSKAAKRKEKLIKQLDETRKYDEQIAVLALSRIDIDLDDGVKVNYEKVQTGPDGEKMKVLGKI